MDQEDLDAAFAAGARLSPGWCRAHVGQQLRALREKTGVSQRCLAEDTGVSQAIISRLEGGGDARFSTVIRLFEGLGALAGVALLMDLEDAQHLSADQRDERKQRQLAGLAVRWGMRYRYR